MFCDKFGTPFNDAYYIVVKETGLIAGNCIALKLIDISDDSVIYITKRTDGSMYPELTCPYVDFISWVYNTNTQNWYSVISSSIEEFNAFPNIITRSNDKYERLYKMFVA